ncbi:MAG TPA: 4Fe-4S binding protein [Aggregatilinea sp.]|uniref:FMN-binding protein n=1 Tax=Aggregatilinea sp. TaxID=2806333 RepID=UPI002C2D24B3|nr:4Fe-4S binding protein [Aggregatilinea sp.]HML20307.1 4Fe-4S binding protein [Aggregatilinea sp.]
MVGVQVIEQHETPGFFDWLREDGYFNRFLGYTGSEPLQLGRDVDAVTGATLSSEAVALAIERAVNTLHSTQITGSTGIVFGWPEVTLIALFASGFFTSRSRNSKAKRWIRLGMLGVGVVMLGFILNKPLTLAHFTAFLSGYWPDWHTHLYWYLLFGGVVLATFARGRNPYCSWFCPFGGVQECLGAIGGAQIYRPQPFYPRFKQLQRGLALAAILLGLALRQPAATSYEPFGTLFAMTGGFFPWMFLVLILFSSLIIRRPFCTYLCPIDPVIEFIGRIRGWTLTRWTKKQRQKKPADPSLPDSAGGGLRGADHAQRLCCASGRRAAR